MGDAHLGRSGLLVRGSGLETMDSAPVALGRDWIDGHELR